MSRFRIDNRYLPPLLITSILLTAHLSFGILEGWEKTALAIVTAIVTGTVIATAGVTATAVGRTTDRAGMEAAATAGTTIA